MDFKSDTPISEALVALFPGKDATKWDKQLADQDIETVGDVQSISDNIWKTMTGLSPVLLSGLGAIRNKKQLVPVGLEHLSRSRNSEFPSLSTDLTFLNLQAQFRAVRQYQTMMVQQERQFVKQIREVTAEFQKKTQDALLLRSLLTDVDDTALMSYYHFLDGNTTDEPILNPQALGAETESLVNQYAQFVQFLREQPRVLALLGPLGGQTQKPWPGQQGAPSKRKSFAEIVCYGVYGSAYQALDSRHLTRALGLILTQELAVHRSRSLGDEAKGDRNVKALRLLGESESANAPSSATYAQSFAVKMAILTFNRFALELCSPFFSPFIHTVCRLDVELEPGSNKEESKTATLARGDIPNTPSQKTAVLKKFVKKNKLAKPGVVAGAKKSAQQSATVRTKDQLQTELTKYCDLLFDAFIKAVNQWPVIVLQTLGIVIREFLRQWPQMRRAHVVFHVFYSQFVLSVLNVDASWAPPTLFPVYMTSAQTNNLRVVMQVVTTILEAAAFKDSGQPERSNKAWGDIANSLRIVAKDYITSKVPVVSEHLTNLANLALKAANAKYPGPVSTKERVFQLGLSIEDVILLRDTLLKHLEEVPLTDPSATLAGLAAEPWTCPYCGAKDKNQNIFCMTCSLPRENGVLNLAVSYDGLRRFANLPSLAASVSKRKMLLRLSIKDTFLDPTPVAERKSITTEPDESLNALRFVLPDLASQIEDIFGNLEAAAPDNEGQVYDIARCTSQVFALDHWDRFEMTSNDLVGFADELHFAITAEMGAAATYLHNPTSEALWRSGSSAVSFLEDLLAWVLLGTGDKSSLLPGAERKFEPSPMELIHSKTITSDFKRAKELVRDSAIQLQRRLRATWTPREHSLVSTLEAMRISEMKLSREIEFLRGLIFHHSLLAICLDTTVQLSVRTQVMLRAPELEDEEEENAEKDTNTFACSSILTLIEQYRKYRSVLETHRHIGAQLLHCFQETLEKKLSKKLKADQLKHASELVEAYICTALFDCLFEEPHSTTRPDAMLAEKLATGAWVRPAHLGLVLLPEKQLKKNVQALLSRQSGAKEISEAAIKAEMDKERQKEADMLRVLWGRPCEELCGIENSITPLRKLLCLTRTIKLIFENLKALSRRSGNFDADTCLSALIGVIIHTPPVRLMANLAYINSFRHINKLDGEDQYCITQFNLAISFISNADFDWRGASSNSLLQRRNTIQPQLQQTRVRGPSRVLQVEPTGELIAMSPLFTVLTPQLDRIFEFLSNGAFAALALTCRLGASQCRTALNQRSMLQSSKKNRREDEKSERAPPPPPPTQENAGDKDEPKKAGACNIPAVAKHSYDATGKQGSHLSFTKGQVLTITKMKGDRWWWAVCGDQKGWVPSSYVTLMGPPPDPAQ